MGTIPSLSIREIPDFIHRFLSSRLVANYLGFYIPNLYDIREFLLENLDKISPSFLKIAFDDFKEDVFADGFEDRVSLDNIRPFISYLLKHFATLEEYFKKKDETFAIQLHFQLPFIHKSILKSEEKKMLFSLPKVRYYNTFRQNLRGVILITSLEDCSLFLPYERSSTVISFPVNDSILRVYILYPTPLKHYWEFVLNKLISK